MIHIQRVLLYIAILTMTGAFCGAQGRGKERNILSMKADEIDLKAVMKTDHSWIALPGYDDRQFWEGLPDGVRKSYIAGAEKYLGYDWPAVKATDYLEIIRSGDRRQEVFSGPSNALNSLVMGELTEGKGRFMDQIINAVWYYCEQTWWGWSAHFYLQKAPNGLPDVGEPTIDLSVGELANNLAWTWYLFRTEFDRIHPLISIRLKDEIMRKVILPYYERNDFWWMSFPVPGGYTVNKPGNPWVDYRNEHNPKLLVSEKIVGSGINNWNPWVNYNMLNCILLMEDDPEKKIKGVQKIISSLDKFPNSYPDDGGCDEGPMYWGVAGAIFYQSLGLLNKVTDARFDVFSDPLIRNMGMYFCKVNIHAPYFINFADADARGGGNAFQVYQYGKSIRDIRMQQFGAHLAKLNRAGERSLSGRICDQIEYLGIMKEIMAAEAKEALMSDFWLPDTQIGGGRDAEGSYKGFFFGAKGGHNSESHNHNDVGSCVMYYDGKPCLIDLGREEYTARTFSRERYDIWTMQSQFHNTPKINGIDQMQGRKYEARNTSFSSNSKKIIFSTDIAGAYPESAMVSSWERTYTLRRGESFTIGDRFGLTAAGRGITGSILMTCCRVNEAGAGRLKFDGEGFSLMMSYDAKTVRPKIEFHEVTDARLKNYWPDGVTRVIMEFIQPGLKGISRLTFTAAE
jgi:hypothetical protein